MAAKSNDIADKVLNIGIVVAVIAGLWFLFKYLKNALGGGNALFGAANSPSAGSGNQPGIDELKHIGDKIAAAYKSKIDNPTKATRIALELEVADKAAKKYWNKGGTNIVINKTLKAVNALPDNEYLDAVNKWLSIEHKDFYDTTLVGAKIYTGSHSEFLVRYEVLTGKVNYPEAANKAGRLIGGIATGSKLFKTN